MRIAIKPWSWRKALAVGTPVLGVGIALVAIPVSHAATSPQEPCQVTYRVNGPAWPETVKSRDGKPDTVRYNYNATIEIGNVGANKIVNWELSWEHRTEKPVIYDYWNWNAPTQSSDMKLKEVTGSPAAVGKQGSQLVQRYQAFSKGYNKTIEPRGTVVIGFLASGASKTPESPTGFVLTSYENGQAGTTFGCAAKTIINK